MNQCWQFIWRCSQNFNGIWQEKLIFAKIFSGSHHCGKAQFPHSFGRLETMRKLCLSAKFPYQEIRWNYGILLSAFMFSSYNHFWKFLIRSTRKLKLRVLDCAQSCVFIKHFIREMFFSKSYFCLFWKTVFEIWVHTICLKYHFINKSFVDNIPLNELSYHFYMSEIPLVRESICQNTLMLQILGKQLYIVAWCEGSGHQIERYWGQSKENDFDLVMRRSTSCH